MKLDVRTSPVSITLLATLRGLHPTVYLLYQVSGHEYYLSTPHNSLLDLAPTKWGPKFPPVKHLERRSIDTSVITIAVGEIGQWKISIPTPAKI